uniref:3'-5' exonuclease domain-containing protein n=1 Tax=Kalanchoe fedtschenkoi TaxID=63787 RepID=A0A7N0VEB2_KALFE
MAAAAIPIRTVDHELPYDTHNIYDIHVDDATVIRTLVTHTPHMVDQWIAEVESEHRRLSTARLVVGLDVEWRPNFHRNQGDNPVAVVQLCVARRCLVFQILHAPLVPASLSAFLQNRSHKFVGVGIESDVEKLVEWWNLNVANQVDLRSLAADKRGRAEYRNAGVKVLARELLGREVEKPQRVTMSRWDAEWLSVKQGAAG